MIFILLMMDIAELAITISDESTKTGDDNPCFEHFTFLIGVVTVCGNLYGTT